MTSIYTQKRFNAAALNGMPDFLAQSDLFYGTVECSSKYVTPIPGMAPCSPPVSPEFIHAIVDLKEGRAATGWNNQTVIAEDTVNNSLYVAAFNGTNVLAMKDGMILKAKTDLPERLVFLLSLHYLLEDEEFKESYELYDSVQDDASKISAMATMYANAYYRDTNNPVTAAFDNKPLRNLNTQKAADPKYIPAEQAGGKFKVFRNAEFEGSGGAPIDMTDIRYGSQYNGKYSLYPTERLTPAQADALVRMDDTMIVSPDAIEVCEMILATKDLVSPVRNILETGLPGTGKTEMAKQIAAMLGLPFYFTQLFDLFTGEDAKGTFQPSSNSSKEPDGELPSAEDIAFDPSGAYEKLTGEIKEDISSEEVMAIRDEHIRASAMGDKTQIVFVPGVIEHACEPSVIFIDEITSPKNPAAITVFNSLLDRSSRITLTDNRVIHRHKNCIIIAAGNFSDDGVEMDGFRDPNRSFLDRFDEVIHLEALSSDMIKAMLIANNDNWDEQRDERDVPIDTFVSILPELKEICMNYGDMCEFRAINAWFRKSLITRKPIGSAAKTVIGISTRQKECADEMMAKIRARFRAE